jgi:hypothetical protein
MTKPCLKRLVKNLKQGCMAYSGQLSSLKRNLQGERDAISCLRSNLREISDLLAIEQAERD